MPITKSAKKALRQTARRKTQNLKRKSAYKAVIKEFKKAIASKSFDKAKQLLPKVYKSLDKASKTNAIKKGKADRLKSRLTVSAQKNA